MSYTEFFICCISQAINTYAKRMGGGSHPSKHSGFEKKHKMMDTVQKIDTSNYQLRCFINSSYKNSHMYHLYRTTDITKTFFAADFF
jgi:hypothetical protein